jgi:hypothetical protein
MKLQFKFSATAGSAGRRRVMRALSERGVEAPQPLLPNETDEELAALYIVDVANQKQADEVLALLNNSSAVEFAESEVRRKLIR